MNSENNNNTFSILPGNIVSIKGILYDYEVIISSIFFFLNYFYRLFIF